jgi:hypothetical protein
VAGTADFGCSASIAGARERRTLSVLRFSGSDRFFSESYRKNGLLLIIACWRLKSSENLGQELGSEHKLVYAHYAGLYPFALRQSTLVLA